MALKDYSWDAAWSVKDLKKVQSNLQKETKKAPDEKAHKAKKQQLERAINDRKLASAQKQFELEQKKNELKQARNTFQQVLGVQQDAQKILKEHKEHKAVAKDKLSQKFSGRKIRNPKVRKQEVVQEIREFKLELQTGDQNSRGETKLIRNIKERESELIKINQYLENNVQEVFNNYEAHSKQFNEVFQDFSQKRQSTDKASLNRKKLKEHTDSITEEKKAISDEIIELATQKKTLQMKFQKECRKYEDNMKQLTALHQLLTHKENVRRHKSDTAVHVQHTMKKNEARQKKQEEKKAKEEKELAEKKAASEKKRQKAIAAYNAMQEKLKASRTVSTSYSVSGGAKKTAIVVNDPNSAEKDLCRNLIVLCESMAPQQRKKKKKNVRLVYRADSFAKFNQVGVKIPKYSKNLADTIKALEQRIVAYDEEPQTEEVAEKEEEEQEEEEEVVVVVAAEPEETVENQI